MDPRCASNGKTAFHISPHRSMHNRSTSSPSLKKLKIFVYIDFCFPDHTKKYLLTPTLTSQLANKANNDPGMVGKSVKVCSIPPHTLWCPHHSDSILSNAISQSILSDFKKTRQDTWLLDLKVRSSHLLPSLSQPSPFSPPSNRPLKVRHPVLTPQFSLQNHRHSPKSKQKI